MENGEGNINQNSRQSNINSICALTQKHATKSNAIEISCISLKEGSWAFKGITEKIQENTAYVVDSFSIPLPISPFKNWFSHNSSLYYNSDEDNAPIGLKWNVDIPETQKNSDKGIPQYLYKPWIYNDTFQFSGAEDFVIDLLITSIPLMIWSSNLSCKSPPPLRYTDLMDCRKPHILKKHVDILDKETTAEYKSYTHFYLKNKLDRTPWITEVPFPVKVISKTIVVDKITDVLFTAEYRHRHVYYDLPKREFMEFKMEERQDSVVYKNWKTNRQLI